MQNNTSFLIARRRNEQRRHAALFFRRMAERTGIALKCVSLVEPVASVALERRVYSHLREGLASGTVARHCHLSLAEAVAHFRRTLDTFGRAQVDVLLSRTPDFAFRCPASVVSAAAQALLEVDGDALTVVVDEGSTGVAIDVETETSDPQLYEVDVWGITLAPP